MNLVQLLIGVVAFVLLFTLVLPLLSGIFHTLVLIILVVAVIAWVLRLFNLNP